MRLRSRDVLLAIATAAITFGLLSLAPRKNGSSNGLLGRQGAGPPPSPEQQ